MEIKEAKIQKLFKGLKENGVISNEPSLLDIETHLIEGNSITLISKDRKQMCDLVIDMEDLIKLMQGVAGKEEHKRREKIHEEKTKSTVQISEEENQSKEDKEIDKYNAQIDKENADVNNHNEKLNWDPRLNEEDNLKRIKFMNQCKPSQELRTDKDTENQKKVNRVIDVFHNNEEHDIDPKQMIQMIQDAIEY